MTGYRVGRQLTEKYMYNRPQLKDNLDVIRFICKEFWGDVFRKQVLHHTRLWGLVTVAAGLSESRDDVRWTTCVPTTEAPLC